MSRIHKTIAVGIAEKADKKTFPLSESLDELDAAESRMSSSEDEYREEDRKCIEKHHECTHDKHNCCKGTFFKYKCHCYDVEDEKGEKRERCACHNPFRYRVVDLAVNIGKKIG
ncbi:U1-lycotoxin-Ls1b like protein [Argiope bruennichi]|uniref:U1-lycotoxin-Ls1b like protein n=1 Tax=Argiope bruennichi TaxID=94029 RepID=A0A8T0EG26_ARGBR|nr:U1-lycotoxin-Ls1b like protein [Argiope bruennichi]